MGLWQYNRKRQDGKRFGILAGMITLYINPYCPYCKKTLETAHDIGLDIQVKSKDDAGVADEVKALGGKKQYPFMVDSDTNTQMYESDDIMEYFREHAPHA